MFDSKRRLACCLGFAGTALLVAASLSVVVLLWHRSDAALSTARDRYEVADALRDASVRLLEADAFNHMPPSYGEADGQRRDVQKGQMAAAGVEELKRAAAYGTPAEQQLIAALLPQYSALLDAGESQHDAFDHGLAIGLSFTFVQQSHVASADGHAAMALHNRASKAAGLITAGAALLGLILAVAFAITVPRFLVSNAVVQAEASVENRFRALVESSSDVILLANRGGLVTYASPSCERVLGADVPAIFGLPVMDLIHPEDRELAASEFRDVCTSADARSGPILLRLAVDKASWKPFEITTVNKLGAPDVEGLVITARDMTDRLDAEAIQRRLMAVVEASRDITILLDRDFQLLGANATARKVFHLSQDLGQAGLLTGYLQGESLVQFTEKAVTTAARTGRWVGDLNFLLLDGTEVPTESELIAHRENGSDVQFYSCIARDLTERKRFESQVAYLASYDATTGLFNRRRFEDELGREFIRSRAADRQCALVVLDVDDFQAANDVLGHRGGDRLLAEIARLLVRQAPPQATVGRLGADEFGISCEIGNPGGAVDLVEALLYSLRDTVFDIDGQEQIVTASLGVALFPADVRDAATLLSHADLALQEAKRIKNAWRFFSVESGIRIDAASARYWERRTRQVLAAGEMVLFAQPIHSAAGGPVGCELLARLPDVDGTLVPPAIFLPHIERSGDVCDLDAWVVREGIGMLAETSAEPSFGVSVNLSGRSLADDRIPSIIAAELARTGVNPSRLTVEITETVAIGDIEQARRFLEPLHELGVSLSIDDFGAGFSSFAYIKHLPVDEVKIDGSWIRNLTADSDDVHVVRAMVELAHGLGKRVVAEYVEDQATAALVRELGADRLQGYYFGRPMPLVELRQLRRAS